MYDELEIFYMCLLITVIHYRLNMVRKRNFSKLDEKEHHGATPDSSPLPVINYDEERKRNHHYGTKSNSVLGRACADNELPSNDNDDEDDFNKEQLQCQYTFSDVILPKLSTESAPYCTAISTSEVDGAIQSYNGEQAQIVDDLATSHDGQESVSSENYDNASVNNEVLKIKSHSIETGNHQEDKEGLNLNSNDVRHSLTRDLVSITDIRTIYDKHFLECHCDTVSNDSDFLLSIDEKNDKSLLHKNNQSDNSNREITIEDLKRTFSEKSKFTIVNDLYHIISPSELKLKFYKEYFSLPYMFGSNFPFSTTIQVQLLGASNHPKRIHGIPWSLMNNERYRLTSFVTFPSGFIVSTIDMASKGFAYLGGDDGENIICYFCSVLLTILKDRDNVDEEHKRMSVECPMVKGTSCNNVSMKMQYPKRNAEEILSELHACRQTEAKEIKQLSIPDNTKNDQQEDTHVGSNRSSQPSDENASGVIVTNTTDLSDSDNTNTQNSEHFTTQSSQIMDDSAVPESQTLLSTVVNSGTAQVMVSSNTVNAPQSQALSSTVVNSSTAQVVVSSNTANGPTESSGTSDNSSTQPNTVTDQSSDQISDSNRTDENSQDTTSYEKLGIITARPKRLEFAVLQLRVNSFKEWPRDHHMKPEDLSRAGYYYTGYSDCARCFYCGGGLRNWEKDDDVWVEHARWFPKCAFLLQEVGKDFIETVQNLSKERDNIAYNDVIQRMQSSSVPSPLTFKERIVERDPAVLSIVDNGYDRNQILELALAINQSGEILQVDKLYEAAIGKNIIKMSTEKNLGSDSVSIRKGGNAKRDQEMIETLRIDNNELRQQTNCKVCLDLEVAVVFLPCGHLVCCTECSCALTACPVCRVGIKGIVRAYMG